MKTYTEEDLRKLIDLVDESYRGVTRDNSNGYYILEDFLKNGFKKVVKEETVSFTYSFLRRKIDWEEFCDLTGISYYAKKDGYEIRDNEVFYIPESKAKAFGLI